MATIRDLQVGPGAIQGRSFPWSLLALVAALFVMYAPTYRDLARSVWTQEEQGHGPLILLVSLWLFWQERSVLTVPRQTGTSVLGWSFLALGLLMYVPGRSQDVLLLDVVSQIPILIGVALIVFGPGALRKLGFPILFLVFLVPLPGFVVDGLTGPLKQVVSIVAEQILHLLGYPIARSGVMLTIGQYQLLVADACSGLHSIFSLSALGVLYLYLMKPSSPVRIVLMVASIVPIAFAANIVRVLILVLVTYHFGDEAGQGFIHGFAGMVLFVSALAMLFLLDSVLQRVAEPQKTRSP